MSKPLPIDVPLGGQTHRLWLRFKTVELGPLTLRQFWMDASGLYRPKAETPSNYWSVVQLFWLACQEQGRHKDRANQETYLLARLLPLTRDKGARRIMADSRLGSGAAGRRRRRQMVQELEQILRQPQRPARMRRLASVELRDRTADILGLPRLENKKVRARKEQIDHELLDDACRLLIHDQEGAVWLAAQRWERAMKRWGRRSGFKLEKLALDIISFEARAALHRCYSMVWHELVRGLRNPLSLTASEAQLIRLWHLEPVRQSGDPARRFHMLHGHILALHPTGALLMESPLARQILGEFLAAPDVEAKVAPWRRLTYSIEAAFWAYTGARERQAERRARRPKADSREIEAEERRRARRTRRRAEPEDD
jgi:hypothetical protein